MQPPEIQLEATGELDLVEVLRRALGGEGVPPSRKRIRGWIEAGSLKVDGEVMRDPRHVPGAGARLDLEPATDPRGQTGDPGRAGPLPVLHLDRHLLVVERPARTHDHASLDEELEACIEAAAIVRPDVQPSLFPPIHPDATGLVLAPLSPDAREALEAALGDGRAALEVQVLTADGVRTLTAGTRGSAGLVADLDAEGVTVLRLPGPYPAVRRPLGLHVRAARLPHPRNARPLAWEIGSAPWAEEGAWA